MHARHGDLSFRILNNMQSTQKQFTKSGKSLEGLVVWHDVQTQRKNKLSRKQVLKISSLINNQKMSIGSIAELYGVSWKAIWYWVQVFKQAGYVIETQKQGRPKKKL